MNQLSLSNELDLYQKGPTPVFLTLQMLVFFVRLDLAFRFFGFERSRAWVMKKSAGSPLRPTDRRMDELVTRTYRAVVAATAFYYRQRRDCLPRALAIYHFLRAKGAPVELRIGVKKFPVSAHAWVEYRGQVVDISPNIARRYVEMKRVARADAE